MPSLLPWRVTTMSERLTIDGYDYHVPPNVRVEVERLRAENERLRAENERLRGVVRATFDLYHEAKTDLDDVRDERDMLRVDLILSRRAK